MNLLIRIVLNIVVNTIAIWVADQLIDGIRTEGGSAALIVVGVIFGLVNTFVKPVVKILSLPALILTLGLFTLVINMALLGLTAALAGSRLEITDLLSNFLGALIISLVSWILNALLPDRS
ncbi:MAG: phage holin family protein [Candidatus Promineifilaceae bacterium]